MKRKRMHKLITFLIVLAMTAVSVSGLAAAEEAAQPREVKVCLIANELSETKWWEYNPATGELGGYVGELFDAIEQIDGNLNFTYEVALSVDLNTMTFLEEADMAAAGYDLALGVYYGEGTYYYVLPCYWLASKVVYVTTDPNAPEVTDIPDLAGTTVMIDKYTYEWMGVRDYNEANPDHQINMELQDSSFIVMGILDGQYKNAIVETGTLDLYREYLATIPALRVYSLPYMDENYFLDAQVIGCRLGEEDLGARITAAMETLIENGTIAELTTKYYGVDRSVPTGEFEMVLGDQEEYQQLINEMLFGDSINYTYDTSANGDSSGDSAGDATATGDSAADATADSTGDAAVAGDSAADATADSTGDAAVAGDSAADASADSSGDSAGTPVVYTDANTVYYVQQALNTAGFNCGTPDGSKGNMTNQAIIEFKAANGMDASNADITDELLIKLGLK